MELIIFGVFLVVSGIAHWVAHVYEKRGGFNHDHANLITGIAATLAHPVVWHAVKEYAIHFLVYSGYILPTH